MAGKVTDKFIADVRALTEGRLRSASAHVVEYAEQLRPGKMLRSRLGASLLATGSLPVSREALATVCVTTELMHAASLCHDDVVDNATMRRGLPTLWQEAGASGAILIGDLVLSEALSIMVEFEGGRFVSRFAAKLREVVEAESEQELLWRGHPVDEATCVRLAREKTGSLFAFVSQACGGDDPALSAALEEAGYRIGTAYQLADDLLDVVGDGATAGKTLGTDALRRKYTLAQGGDGGRALFDRIYDLCASALSELSSYPEVRKGLAAYLTDELQPILNQHLALPVELTA